MKRTLMFLFLVGAGTAPAGAEAIPAEGPITSLGLFKNGLALVTRVVQAPADGEYSLEDTPEPVHGTFWVESSARVEARMSMAAVDVPAAAGRGADLQRELVGSEVTILFREGEIPPVTGRVIAPDSDSTQAPLEAYDTRGDLLPQPPMGRFLVLDTGRGLTYVDASMVAYAHVMNARETVTRRRPVLLLSVSGTAGQPATISISYLARGLSWAPSYRVDLSQPAQLEIRQNAVVRNELADVADADVQLISGFPNVQFGHVRSPLSLQTSWSQFFNELRLDPRPEAAVLQQLVLSNAAVQAGPADFSALPLGDGPDIHYQPVGKKTLKKGDAVVFETASATADYARLVEWVVPDTRGANGRPQERSVPDDEQVPWDAVRFRNPFDFPMTTGPAMFVAGDRFLGQQMSTWVNSGEEATLRVTKALSIRTLAEEHEERGERETVSIGGRTYQKTRVQGSLRVSNHRNEEVHVVIRRRFSGELVEAEGEPRATLLEEGVWSVNQRNELTWTVDLDPGAETTLTYRYDVLVLV